MNEVIVKDNIKIEDLIYEVRGKQVMLDSDLAKLYECKNGTKEINQAVKNNIEKFPERYCFKLTDKESHSFLVKSFDQKIERRGGKYKNPRVFTEQGVYMLATVLKSKAATQITIAIMDAFVVMKNIINSSLIEQKYINNLVLEHDSKINIIFDKLGAKEKISHIFFDGQIYDAYSLLIEILSKANKEIVIIDNYAGKELFDITKNIKTNIKVYTKNIDNVAKTKYENQYNNLTIINTDIFHDRFIIIDKKILYNLGSSLKDIGKKCTSINKIEDTKIIIEIVKRLSEVENE
ncbi:MAG: ORF6N domain-containing protein [Bacilli bacterium]